MPILFYLGRLYRSLGGYLFQCAVTVLRLCYSDCRSAAKGSLRGKFETGLCGTLANQRFCISGSDQTIRIRELVLSSSTDRHEVFGSSEQTVWVAYYSTNSQRDGLDKPMLKIFSGPRPFDLRAEEHIWLALMSQGFFDKELPMRDPGLCMAEPSIVTVAESTKRDASPKRMEWHNERADGKKETGQRLDGLFRWLASTNMQDGLNVPISSELVMSITTTNAAKKLLTISEMVVKRIRPLDREPSGIPL